MSTLCLKTCNTCGLVKSEDDFHKRNDRDNNRTGSCKECINARRKEIYNPDRTWELRLKRTYNITVEKYYELLDMQNGVCAICEGPSEGKFHIDHNHNCCSGKTSCGNCVRGLLCLTCNVALGHLKDSKRLLTRALEYLDVYALPEDL